MLKIQGLHHVHTMSFCLHKCVFAFCFVFLHQAERATLQVRKKNHSHKLLHSGFHFPDILDNSWAAGNSVWETDFQPKQIAAVDRWNEKWVDSLMLKKSQKHADQSCEWLLIFIQEIYISVSIRIHFFFILISLQCFSWQKEICNNFNKCHLMVYFSWKTASGFEGSIVNILRSSLIAFECKCNFLAFSLQAYKIIKLNEIRTP